MSFLGGDVHVATFAIFRSTAPRHAAVPTIYQLTSSPIANHPSAFASRMLKALNRRMDISRHIRAHVFEILDRRNFGIVDVDASGENPRIRFEVHQEDVDEPRIFDVWTFGATG